MNEKSREEKFKHFALKLSNYLSQDWEKFMLHLGLDDKQISDIKRLPSSFGVRYEICVKAHTKLGSKFLSEAKIHLKACGREDVYSKIENASIDNGYNEIFSIISTSVTDSKFYILLYGYDNAQSVFSSLRQHRNHSDLAYELLDRYSKEHSNKTFSQLAEDLGTALLEIGRKKTFRLMKEFAEELNEEYKIDRKRVSEKSAKVLPSANNEGLDVQDCSKNEFINMKFANMNSPVLLQFLKTIADEVSEYGEQLAIELGMEPENLEEVRRRLIDKVVTQQIRIDQSIDRKIIEEEIRRHGIHIVASNSELTYAYLKWVTVRIPSEEEKKDKILEALRIMGKTEIATSLDEGWRRLTVSSNRANDPTVNNLQHSNERPAARPETRDKFEEYLRKLAELLSSEGPTLALNLGMSYDDVQKASGSCTIVDARRIALRQKLQIVGSDALKAQMMRVLKCLKRNDLVSILESEGNIEKWIMITSSQVGEENFFRFICGFDEYEVSLKMVTTKKHYSDVNYELLQLFCRNNSNLSEIVLRGTINRVLSELGHLNTLEKINDFWRSLNEVPAANGHSGERQTESCRELSYSCESEIHSFNG
ncbi:DgyrCDS9930 [Dimorphilus gyrociliatus]|uniref:DgyrCDS9930 n=1 Tax=Dimorphilus gyrociliatus TaxID=2664684 RepID=A0A7I8W3S6_9ANNE|nr:DgyrCDS9930 [Dimorphilus gyrociliatus]